MDEVEKQILDLAHDATLAVGRQMEAEMGREYGQYSRHIEPRVRKLNRQGPNGVKVRAWLAIPRTVSRGDAIATGMRLSSSTATHVEAPEGKVLKFEGRDGEDVYRKRVRRPSKIPSEPFERITGSWESRLTSWVRSNA